MEPVNLSMLREIYRTQPVTRRELGRRAGLSASRISALVGPLLAHGLVREEPCQGGSPGRPAAVLRINADAGRLAGLDIGGRHSRAMLCDLTGGTVASVTWPTAVVDDRGSILDSIVRLVQGVCELGATPPAALAGLGVGLQGIVDAHSGTVLGWPNTPAWADAWAGLPVGQELRRRLGTRLVVVDDSVRAMGVAACRAGQAQGSANLLYVYLGDGIGSTLVLDGAPYRAPSGLSGELGHVSVEEDGPSCSCGNRGCLEVMASAPAILRRVQERLAESWLVSSLREAQEANRLSLAALLAAARDGDKLAFQVLDEAGMRVGLVIAIALNLVGSELVVLGGPLVADGGIILDAVQRQVRLRALAHISRRVRIVYDDQGELAGARGAALLALDALFGSPEHMESLLLKPPSP